MTTVINTPGGSTPDNSGGNMAAVVTVIILLIVVLLFFFYGLPLLRQSASPAPAANQQPASQPGINVPDQIDVNVNQKP